MHCKKTFAALLIIIALVGTGVFFVKNSKVLTPDEIAEMAAPSIVTIVATKDLPLYKKEKTDFFSDPFFDFPFAAHNFDRDSEDGDTTPVKTGNGSGFIFDKRAQILTAHHIVSDEEADYTVITSDGTQYIATVQFADPIYDIAVLRILDEFGQQPYELPYLNIGNSARLRVDDDVVAMGSNARFASGEISAVKSSIAAGTFKKSIKINDLLQLDVPITTGFSGGPLINRYGLVVGINVAFSTDDKNVGFAIPINKARFALLNTSIFKEAD